MFETIGQSLRVLVAAAVVVASSGCGTIMYPERRGQRGGRIDAGVAVLDAVGLLFFIIPGVIAFVVDFGNGTIYLPSGKKSFLGRGEPVKIRFEPKGDAKASVERIIRERTGLAVRLDGGGVEVSQLASAAEIPACLAAAYGGLAAR